MKSHNSNRGSHAILMVVLASFILMTDAMLQGCATRPIKQPQVYQGQVHNRVDRSPQVGDTGTVGAAQFVYTPAGWVRI